MPQPDIDTSSTESLDQAAEGAELTSIRAYRLTEIPLPNIVKYVCACWRACLFSGLCLTSVCRADDRVTFIPRGASDPVVLIGTIEDLTGAELQFRRSGQTVSDHYPADAVVSFQTWRTEVHLQGIELLKTGENALSEQALLKSLREESRHWVLREILADLVRCAIRRGDWEAAGERFRQITDQDPLTPHWNVAPTFWAPHSLSDQQKALARQWMREENPPLRLMAASWLLLDPVYGEPAEKMLVELSRGSNSFVTSLARTQQWRLRLGSDISEVELRRWQSEMGHLPRPLRAGPQYLIGRGWQQRHEWRTAAAELLWVGMVYTDNEDLSARSLVEAGGALDKTGLPREAQALYQLTIEKYEWSSWSNEARSLLSSSATSRENASP